MRKINKDEFKEFEIEDGIFLSCVSPSKVIKITEFLTKKIESELNKSFDLIDDGDVAQIVEMILKLTTTEILYSIMGILEYYTLETINEKDTKTKTIEKLLVKVEFEKYRHLINDVNDSCDYMRSFISLTESELLVIQSKIENFEQEHNITILYE